MEQICDDDDLVNESGTHRRLQTLLVVDDDPDILTVLADFFQGRYRVLVADSGELALDIAQRADIDLILLDVQMPGLDGHQTCKRLKQSPQTTAIPVIFVTGLNSLADEIAGLELGAIDYITKPYSLQILWRRVDNHMTLVRYQRELQRVSGIDGLTGLANRMQLDAALLREWHTALRRKEPISIIMIDIDDFKSYNDFYGHIQGDRCLKAVAAAIGGFPRRPNDVVGRYGGEEFLVALPNTKLRGAAEVAKSIHRAVADLKLPHGALAPERVVSISLGVACHAPGNCQEQADSNLHQLVSDADSYLYKAKHAGRNRIYLKPLAAETAT